ncbi:MAG: hypothetical protein ABI461_11610, partial [Polyangiaceae bacterium]
MQRSLVWLAAVSAAATFIACGGNEAPPPANANLPPVVSPNATAAFGPLDAGADPAVATAAPPPAPGPKYPPPKASTIALASSAGDVCDIELKAGDDAFEANDLEGAQKHYSAAKAAGLKRSGPIVGLARVRIAKQNVAYDFAAAKGNKEITAAVKDLRAAVKSDASSGAAHVELGRALLLLGDAAGAIDA